MCGWVGEKTQCLSCLQEINYHRNGFVWFCCWFVALNVMTVYFFVTSTRRPHVCIWCSLKPQAQSVRLILPAVFFTNQTGRSTLNYLYLIEPILNALSRLPGVSGVPSCCPHHPHRQETSYCPTTAPTAPSVTTKPNHNNVFLPPSFPLTTQTVCLTAVR